MKTAKHTELLTKEMFDKSVNAYLGGFDNFSHAVMKRYGAGARETLTPEAMISLYRGFLTALPSIEEARVKVEKSA